MSFPDRAYDAAVGVLEAIVASYLTAVDDRPDCRLPDRRYVTVGQVAYDCAQLVVTAGSTVAHSGDLRSPGTTTIAGHASVRLRAVRLGVVLLRNAPVAENGLPSTALEYATAKLVLADAEMLSRAVRGVVRNETLGINAVAVGDWLSVTSQGGLIGGTLDVMVSLEGL